MTNTEGSDIPNSHTERKPGYYWVKLGTSITVWCVRQWHHGEWWDGEFKSYPTEIDPTPITRAPQPETDTIGITYYQIACETITDQAERIKELEAEVARNTTIVKYDPVLTEAMRQQAQEVERLREEVARLEGKLGLAIMNDIHNRADAALQSPSSAKDTPDIATRFGPMPQDVENKLTEYIMNIGFRLENRKHIRHGARWCYAQSSPVSVDINRELEALDYDSFCSLIGAAPHHGIVNQIWDTLDYHGYRIIKASPPKQSGE